MISEIEIETEYIDYISGIPENVNPGELKNNIDYSKRDNLKIINELPVINITNINGDTSAENGQYNISAKIVEQKNNKLRNKYDNVEIKFSMPESSGLCLINIDKDIKMVCENKEKFEVSQILIERNVIKDEDGNDIFIINSFTNLEVFGCDISYYSIVASDEPDVPVNQTSNYHRKNKNNGLTGGAIAGIVIASVAIVAIVLTLIVLTNKGILFGKKIKNNEIPTETSVDKFESTNKI